MPRLPHAIGAAMLAVSLVAPALVAPSSNAAPEAGVEDARRPVVLVLDSSGSMAEPAPGGASRMAVARTAVRHVARRLPDDQELGLRVYGAEVFDRSHAGACQDSSVAVPIGPGTGASVADALRTLRPYGETPIGYALQQAVEDLRSTGAANGSIVLVSDGEPTCEPDPCDVARSIGATSDLIVDVVGLDVDASTRSSLSCIAEAAGGTYYDAADAADLAASLTVVTERAGQAYAATGRAVTGAPFPVDAPVVTDGAWLDSVAPSDPPSRFYRVQRQIPGSTLHISASAAEGSSRDGITPLLSVFPSGQAWSCSSDGGGFAGGGLAAASVTIGTHVWAPGGPMQAEDSCMDDELNVEVSWHEDTATVRPPTTIELAIIEEPPVADPASVPAVPRLAAPVPDVMPVPAPAARIRPVAGGGSFTGATPLVPGRYRDTIVVGEHRVYGVELSWGQRLSVEVTASSQTPRIQEILNAPNVALSGGIFGPGRSSETGDPLTTTIPSMGEHAVLTTRAVDWSHRRRPPLEGGSALAGRHYVVLQLQNLGAEEHPSYPVPVRLDVAVDGHPVAPPPYIAASLAAEQATSRDRTNTLDSTKPGAGAGAAHDEDPLSLLEVDAGNDTDSASWERILLLGLIAAGGSWLLLRRRQERSPSGGRRRAP